jgi:hypothetical protein
MFDDVQTELVSGRYVFLVRIEDVRPVDGWRNVITIKTCP